MKKKTNVLSRVLLWVVISICSIIVVAFLAIIQPGGDGVLGRIKTQDGSEYLVEQSCNWGFEPYTVSFYMSDPDGNWGWCYIDHEASRWKDVEVSYDAHSNQVIVTEKGVKRASLNCKTKVFWIDNGSIRRDLVAPQDDRSPRFAKL
jgi:hypothetical protein|tara:strand:+ start:82 stop:522 length:441 start_codon:yes stop_codon:yes gene_type:complete